MKGLLLKNAFLLSLACFAVVIITIGLGQIVLAAAPRRQLAYAARRFDDSHIVLMDIDRGLSVPLQRRDDLVVNMVWSPADDRLALNAYTLAGQFVLDILHLDGTRRRLTSEHLAGHSDTRWSPDASWVAFTRHDGPDSRVLIASVTGEDVLEVVPATSTNSLSWSPDSAQVVYAGREPDGSYDLYLLDVACLDGGCPPRRLTEHSATDHVPVWSPDGSQVTFISDREGYPSVYIIDAICEQSQCPVRRVTDLQVNSQPLVWSPDGRWLAFNVASGGVGSALYLADMRCGNNCDTPVYRISAPEDTDNAIAWSPDSRLIAFVTHFLNITDVVVMDTTCIISGAECSRRLLTRHDAIVSSPAWRPASGG